jgi:hypothetical protein
MKKTILLALCLFPSLLPANSGMPPFAFGDTMVIRHSDEAKPGPILRIPAKRVGIKAVAAPSTKLPNLAGGLFLSTAIVLTGLWAVRRRRGTAPIAAAVGTLLIAATLSLADIRLPTLLRLTPEARLTTQLAPALEKYPQLWENVTLEISGKAERIELLLPPRAQK